MPLQPLQKVFQWFGLMPLVLILKTQGTDERVLLALLAQTDHVGLLVGVELLLAIKVIYSVFGGRFLHECISFINI